MKNEVVVYKTLKEFYPYYLSEHRNGINRLLHFIGTSLAGILILYALFTSTWNILLYVPFAGYRFFFFVKNF